MQDTPYCKRFALAGRLWSRLECLWTVQAESSPRRSQRPTHPGGIFAAPCACVRLSPSTRERLRMLGRPISRYSARVLKTAPSQWVCGITQKVLLFSLGAVPRPRNGEVREAGWRRQRREAVGESFRMPFGDAAAPVRHGAVAGTQTVSSRPARGIQTLSPQAIEDFAQGTGGLSHPCRPISGQLARS